MNRWILALTQENTLNKNHAVEVEIPEDIAQIVWQMMKERSGKANDSRQSNAA